MAKISTPLFNITATRSAGFNRIYLLSTRLTFSDRNVSGNKFLRSSSSDDSADMTLWRRFVNTVKLMAKGSKLIVTDFKKMLEIRKAAIDSEFYLLSGKAPKRMNVTISRADLSFVIQVLVCNAVVCCNCLDKFKRSAKMGLSY